MSDNGKNRFGLTPEGRIAFLESLFETAEPWVDHTPIFVEYLDDEDPQVRVIAIQGLWYNPDPNLIDRLLKVANQDPSEMVRAQAISALGMYVHEGVVADYEFDYGPMADLLEEAELPEADFKRVKAFLLSVYADDKRSLNERRYAIESLGFLGKEVAHLIEEAYHRPEKDMKVSAIFAMGRSGMVRWADILARELNSSEPDIQLEAVRAVGAIGLTELGEDVYRLTYSEDKDLMLEAVEALGQTGWEEGFERLDELASDPDPEIAEIAEEALSEWFLLREIADQADDLDADWYLDDDLDADWEQED